MTERGKKKPDRSRIVNIVIVLVLTSLWMLYALLFWMRRYPFFRTIDIPYLTMFENSLDPAYLSAVSVYLHLAPFLFLIFYVTNLLPKSLGAALKNRRTAVLYRIFAVLISCFGLALMIASCTEIPSYLNSHITGMDLSAFVSFSDKVYPWLTPVLLFTGIFTAAASKLTAKKKKSGLLPSFLTACLICPPAGVMICAVSGLLLALIRPVLPGAVTSVEGFCRVLASSSSMCLIGLVLAPLIEETAFRGIIQHHLGRCTAPWFAVVWASVMFGLWHRNIGQFVYTFFFGLIAGWIYEITVKIHTSIIIHFFMNLSAVLAFSDSEAYIFGNQPWANGIYARLISLSPLIAALSAAAAIAVLAGLILLVRRITPKED